MPQIFDNIDKDLLTALTQAMGLTERADFCVGYFNLRGWRRIDPLVENWAGGDGHCCRLLVGMQQWPQDQLRSAMSLARTEEQIDQATAIVRKRKLSANLMHDLDIISERRAMRFSHDDLTVQCIIPKLSKPIIDEIDRVLPQYYGFTDEELDFIINYDIKYRMGQEEQVEGEE